MDTHRPDGDFSVVGSVSGNAGTLTLGTLFQAPDTANYAISLTGTAGVLPCAAGDVFTFTTTAAGATVAAGIASETIDARHCPDNPPTTMYVSGAFRANRIIGLDPQGIESINRRVEGNLLILA